MNSRHLVVVGGGMVAQRLVEALRDRDAAGTWRITVLAEEPRRPYDRVALTSYFSGRKPEELELGDAALWDDPLVTLVRDDAVTAVDRDARTVTAASGRTYAYDHLVLATGSYAWVPPTEGADLPGVFVYRTIDDVAALRGYVEKLQEDLRRPVRGAVLGGGLLGLEAAGALHALGAQATVLQVGSHLMDTQLDLGGGEALRRLINAIGIGVRVNAMTVRIRPHRRGGVGRLDLADGGRVDADVVVVAAGVRPRDELARAAGLEVGPRGGVVVDDTCLSSDPAVSAVGEVACIQGACIGLVAPGYAMAEVTADRLLGGAAEFPGADTATKLKLAGVDVASFGDAFGRTEGALELVWADPVAGVYKKLVMSDDARTLLGGVLVGDASAYASLRPMLGRELPGDPAAFLLPEGGGSGAPDLELPDDAGVCSCNNVSAGTIRAAVTEHGCTDVGAVKACTRAGTSCGSCLPLVKKLVTTELSKQGITVSSALCEHFALSRAQLYDAVLVSGVRSFTEVVERFGTRAEGRGCDICKPAVASILATTAPAHVLEGERAALQDTNDHVMANLQKDGSYSVVPRIPGGEVTPEGLIAIGEVAKDFGLYTKITGGQRIDMFGARIDQLPLIWQRLVDAGFESGHAYGKSLRTVKSCVGSTWCRFGVQDSVALAVLLELRYRGLRSPHKLKMGVSGCARECAEARGKDVGVIATDKGWNVYVGGNGGFTPKHAVLLAEDLSTEDLIRTIDRFLLYYIRTADRLQRTAPWLEELEGGVDALRGVVLEDTLGIAADLDEQMARHVTEYEDEWRATLEDPEKLRRFASFVNAPQTADPSLAYVPERGQARPATADERDAALRGEPVLVAGTTLEVRA
ncbi:nitrite reductase large subunit NirB [Cellulomonas fimi]|uniref:assimilatory sulfite reductase (ferredoxin) n=1 Tax=Cellulomonas fimi (strain ATCC 484 / DSM 20113 / JCM 1341 / CCUG 24087 / LMG 16345 / NBRC 15513 / NCIMB 8980 / NCTC 7547 / NRS-133) TaxID=590998 RepID=F4H447_CELFA|nr:nitrite reductase large subunit NirB [Cellulomonas fimi]AEE45399.1 nitrite reductase (NAD(P)H), large subunit [Cellulomonas fimi ATCC 484]NNH06848.1 nitrite reductase large subunit [Cellulomonas fimi]VEH29259.1 Anthranilate 1,2-dioxygenase system ferredoxin--NAD(+) reductase component [Cellulomonas fimi]